MRKIFKIAALVAVGVVAYKKLKDSEFLNKESDNVAKATAETIKEKVNQVMKDEDVIRMIKRKAQQVVDDIFAERSLDHIIDNTKDDILREAKRRVRSKVMDSLFD